MDKQGYAGNNGNGFPFILLFCGVAFLGACGTAKETPETVMDRAALPEVRADVPAAVSEIREIKFNHLHKEDAHKDLHLAGQLFTKSGEGGAVQIRPCAGCTVVLRGIKDTSTVARLTTANDGYFSFHGQRAAYSLITMNPGMNRVELDHLEFDTEGVTTIKIVNANGGAVERFRVSKSGTNYTWTMVQ